MSNRRWRVHGLDTSLSGIALAQQCYPEHTWSHADLIVPLSFHNEFDLVVSLEVVEHVYDPRGFARNCFDALKPGGELLISTPYHGWLKNVALAVSGKMDAHYTALWPHGHIKFWSPQTLTKLLHDAGFTNIRFQGAGRLPWLWNSMILKASKPRDV